MEAIPMLYFAQQQLAGLLVLKTVQAKRARKMFPQLLVLLEQFAHGPAQALASTPYVHGSSPLSEWGAS